MTRRGVLKESPLDLCFNKLDGYSYISRSGVVSNPTKLGIVGGDEHKRGYQWLFMRMARVIISIKELRSLYWRKTTWSGPPGRYLPKLFPLDHRVQHENISLGSVFMKDSNAGLFSKGPLF